MFDVLASFFECVFLLDIGRGYPFADCDAKALQFIYGLFQVIAEFVLVTAGELYGFVPYLNVRINKFFTRPGSRRKSSLWVSTQQNRSKFTCFDRQGDLPLESSYHPITSCRQCSKAAVCRGLVRKSAFWSFVLQWTISISRGLSQDRNQCNRNA